MFMVYGLQYTTRKRLRLDDDLGLPDAEIRPGSIETRIRLPSVAR